MNHTDGKIYFNPQDENIGTHYVTFILYDNGEPVPWEKVHVMPDYVKFNHKRHVKAGVACQECHGQVPQMEVVERQSSMKMGWCLDCHRERGASIDCGVCHY